MSKPYPGTLLQYGSTGQAVKDVQAALGLKQTGTYDHATKSAVMVFQARNQIMQNGQVGPTTWGKLFPSQPESLILPVKYFTQRDSEVVARGMPQANRSCFSSCNAMIVEYLKPGTLPGTNGDDTYLRKVLSEYGDTTDPAAQTRCMTKGYGIPYTHRTNATFQDVIDHIWKKRIPVNLGHLHHGPVSAPYGGHRILAIGFNKQGLIVHDPFGESDLRTGEWVGDSGRELLYSFANLGPRFVGASGREGWAGFAERP